MAADVTRHLDRAKKFLEKNRVEDAIEAYLGGTAGSAASRGGDAGAG